MKKKTFYLTVALLFATTLASAQTAPLASPVRIGGDIYTHDDLHIHETVLTEYELPPSFGNRDQVTDGYYLTTVHLTNTLTGTTGVDGLLMSLQDKNAKIQNYEGGRLSLMTKTGIGIVMDSNGRIGLGAEPVNAWAVSLGGNTIVTGTLNASGACSFGGVTTSSATVSGDITVGGGARIGDGFSCSQDGLVRVKELRVTVSGWSDFVFDDGYRLPSLYELEDYINRNRHLPDIPTTAEVEGDGADLGAMNAKLLQKIEELTLYVIDLQKQIDELKTTNKQ
jgi:hypothetical protein